MKKLFFYLIFSLALATNGFSADKPNVLIIIADDCTFNDLPLYGGQNAKTPNIDRLAKEGLVFNRAYLSMAMCTPCRAELYTGQYPIRNGTAHNHGISHTGTLSMPQHLRPLGYRVGLTGKVHVKPRSVFPFDVVPGFDASSVRNPTNPHDLDGIRKFMHGDAQKPFALVVALTEPHVPWVMGDASQYPPDSLILPVNIADTKTTRTEFSAYLAEITYMDGQVGEILQALQESGHADNTLVLFTSEQGAQFPGCKWTNYDTGIHTALIARWPGVVSAGLRTDAIVQYVDVLPTLLDMAGKPATDGVFDGSSFLPVLKGQATSHAEYAYGIHNNIPEGPSFPIRSVTDGTFRYIRNLAPGNVYIEKHMMGEAGGAVPAERQYWSSWMGEAWNNEQTYHLVKRFLVRPAEELYNTAEDPFEMVNLAGLPEHVDRMARLSAKLDRWMAEQGDPGVSVDTHEVFDESKKGKANYGPKR